ncbi:MAG: LamG domain-containing protein, partial [Candidatus Hermodarchaeia archaeon]
MNSKTTLIFGLLTVFLLLTASTLIANAEITSGLIAYWKLDETSGTVAADSSSNGQDGSLVNGPVWSAGFIDGGLDFDGTDDYVDVGQFDINGNALTIAAWFKADTFDHLRYKDGRIVSKAVGIRTADHYWMLSSIDDSGIPRLRFRLKTSGTTSTLIASSGDLEPGVWIHAAVIYDGSTMKIYKDGVLVGDTPKSGNIDSGPTAQVWIGNNPPTDSSKPFDGMIDDVRLYDRALTEEEIQELMNYSAGNQAPIVDAGLDQTIVIPAPAILDGT